MNTAGHIHGHPTEEATAVLKALSDPNRLRIFARLMQGDTCNCELVQELNLPANLLSHHLRAVSYTHLDVYKRQLLGLTTGQEEGFTSPTALGLFAFGIFFLLALLFICLLYTSRCV